jgi:chitodextrinase
MSFKLFGILSVFLFFSHFISAKEFLLTSTDSLSVFIGSGENQVLIPLPDSVVVKSPDIQVESANTSLLEIITVDYADSRSFVILKVKEKGIQGKAGISVNMTYNGGSASIETEIHIVPYYNPGLLFQIHDIVFWQQAIPLNGVPVYEKLIQTSEGPYNSLNYSEIPITVNMDCNSAVCTGHDFYTSFYKGYVVPPVDGTYHFYMRSQDSHTFWLSANEKFSDAKLVVGRSATHGNVGTEIGNNTTKSADIVLKAGKVYAFYATQWIIHSTIGGIMWDGPGISMGFIPGKYTMPVYDIVKPSAPGNLKMDWRSSTGLSVNWNPSSDNNKVSGYSIYANGTRVNSELIKGDSYKLENLKPGTRYQLVVTAVDQAGNESMVSNVLSVETHAEDNQSPTPPQQLDVLQRTGLALKIKWSGATDGETEVIAYNLYINDELYKTTGFLFADSAVIHNLLPETTYSITIESVDAGLNVSAKSEAFTASTAAFDPTGPNLGERVGKVVVFNKNTTWNEGIGLNGPYENGDMVSKAEVRKIIEDFQPGAIRWGAISANSKSFQGSVGPGKVNTYGRMLNFANQLGARFALTVGVQEGIDYINEPKTFLYLLEYLAGDASTTWGAVRASEGFTEPLLQKGKGILLEFGNEVWGAAAHDAQIGSDYAKYAKWVRDMSDVVKSSPYYDPEKIIMVYSGRNPHPDNSYGVNNRVLTGDRGHAESLGVAGYLGGNLNYDQDVPKGDTELDYYKSGFELAKKNMDGFVLTMKDMLSLTGTIKTFYLYESNMTTTSYNGRFGQAIAMTDYMANSMNYGSIVPSIFHLTGGEWRITQPADNYKRLPLYNTGMYFNKFCKGHTMQTQLISNNKITNTYGQPINYDPVGAYAYNSGENFSVLLMNRDFENDFTIQLELPSDIGFSDKATIYTLWENDFSSYNTKIDSAEVSLTPDLLIKVPKFGMVVINFKGDNPDYEKLPLGYWDRKRPESLKVFSTRNFIINTNKGTDVISTEVLPSDAFSAVAVMDVLENNTKSILTTLSGGRLHIKASGVCGDEGNIVLHVYASDNHELSDTVTVQITNQGVDCPATGIGDFADGNNVLFYPNPATEKIYINSSLDSRSKLEITDSSGRTVFRNDLNNGYEIRVSNFNPGLYIIGILKPDGTTISGKFQKL